jgi:uncharacterized Zn finger protein (UPF0148 family)
MKVIDDLKEEINKLPDEELLRKAPSIVKRCPRCKNLTLEFDYHTGNVHCSKCGFNEKIILK